MLNCLRVGTGARPCLPGVPGFRPTDIMTPATKKASLEASLVVSQKAIRAFPTAQTYRHSARYSRSASAARQSVIFDVPRACFRSLSSDKNTTHGEPRSRSFRLDGEAIKKGPRPLTHSFSGFLSQSRPFSKLSIASLLRVASPFLIRAAAVPQISR